MEKIFVDDCSECGKLNTNIKDVCEKLNEIVDWINEREKNNRHKLTVDDWKKLGGGEGASRGGA